MVLPETWPIKNNIYIRTIVVHWQIQAVNASKANLPPESNTCNLKNMLYILALMCRIAKHMSNFYPVAYRRTNPAYELHSKRFVQKIANQKETLICQWHTQQVRLRRNIGCGIKVNSLSFWKNILARCSRCWGVWFEITKARFTLQVLAYNYTIALCLSILLSSVKHGKYGLNQHQSGLYRHVN